MPEKVRVHCRSKGAQLRAEIWNRFKEDRRRDFLFVYPTAARARYEKRRRVEELKTIPSDCILSSSEFLDLFVSRHSPDLLLTTDLPLVIQWLVSTGQLELPSEFVRGSDERQLPSGVLKRLAAEIESSVYAVDKNHASSQRSNDSIQHFAEQFVSKLRDYRLRYRDAEIARLWQQAAGNSTTVWTKPVLKETESLVLDGFWTFSPALWGFIKCFSQICSSVGDSNNQKTLHIIFDYAPSTESEPYPHLDAIWKELISWKSEVVEISCGGDHCECTQAAPSPALEIRWAPTPNDEVGYIARRLRTELGEKAPSADSSSRARSIALCFPNLSRAYPYLRMLFREWGILYRVRYMLPLTSSPLWDFFLRLVNVVAVEKDSQRIPLSALEDLLEHPWRKLLFPNWSQLETRLFRRLRRRFGEPPDLDVFLTHLEKLDSPVMQLEESAEEEISQLASPQRLTKLSETLKAIKAELRCFQGEHTPQEWYTLVYRKLHTALWRLSSAILPKEKREPRLHQLARPLLGRTADDVRLVTACVARMITLLRRYHLILSTLASQVPCADADNHLQAVQPNSTGPTMCFRPYLDGLSLLIENDKIADRIRILDGIEVISPEETVGQRFDYVIFGGLVEGQMPSFELGDLFKKGVPGLSTEETVLSEQRYIFHKVLQAAPRVLLTYARHEDDAELLRSQFLEELCPSDDGQPIDNQFSPGTRDRLKDFAEGVRKLSCRIPFSTEPPELASKASIIDQLVWNRVVQLADQANGFTPFDGELGFSNSNQGGIPKDALGLEEEVFTAYQLQELVDCPLIYFFKRILGVSPPERERFVWAMERGQLIHRILCKIIEEMKDIHSRDEAFARLNEITLEKLHEAYPNDPVRQWSLASELLGYLRVIEMYGNGSEGERALAETIKGLVSEISRNSAQGILQAFLEDEITRNWQQDDGTWAAKAVPDMLEWRFGFKEGGHGPITLPDGMAEASTFKLRGVIDRVDRCGSGFWIIDYKTGSSCPPKRDLAQGRAVQLPLYAAALEKVDEKKGRASGLAYYHLGRTKITFISIDETGKGPTPCKVIRATLDTVLKALAKARDGHFYPLGAAPQDGKAFCSLYHRECPFYMTCCRGCESGNLLRKVRSYWKRQIR